MRRGTHDDSLSNDSHCGTLFAGSALPSKHLPSDNNTPYSSLSVSLAGTTGDRTPRGELASELEEELNQLSMAENGERPTNGLTASQGLEAKLEQVVETRRIERDRMHGHSNDIVS